MQPYLSVVIIAHDRKDFLLNAVNSVLAQDLDKGRFEILVVKNFMDPEIDRYLKDKDIVPVLTDLQQIGSKIAFAMKSVQGEVICFLEDDDLFSTEKLSKISDYFARDQKLIYLHNAFDTIDRYGNAVNRVPFFMRNPREEGQLDFGGNCKDGMRLVYKYGLHFNLSSISIRKRAIKPEFLVSQNIADVLLFYMAILTNGGIRFIPDRLTQYMVHNSDSKSLDLGIEQFTESKIRFHGKISESLSLASKMLRGTVMEKYALCDLAEQSLVRAILNPKTKKREILSDVVNCIGRMKLNYGRKLSYEVALSILGLFSIIQSRLPVMIMYSVSRIV